MRAVRHPSDLHVPIARYSLTCVCAESTPSNENLAGRLRLDCVLVFGLQH